LLLCAPRDSQIVIDHQAPMRWPTKAPGPVGQLVLPNRLSGRCSIWSGGDCRTYTTAIRLRWSGWMADGFTHHSQIDRAQQKHQLADQTPPDGRWKSRPDLTKTTSRQGLIGHGHTPLAANRRGAASACRVPPAQGGPTEVPSGRECWAASTRASARTHLAERRAFRKSHDAGDRDVRMWASTQDDNLLAV
jgi:hypothetical protein